MTMRKFTHKHLSDVTLAFVDDGRDNVALSLAIDAAKIGMDFRLISSRALWPYPEFLVHVRELAATNGGKFQVLDDVRNSVAGADFVYADVWLSSRKPCSLDWGQCRSSPTEYLPREIGKNGLRQ